MSGKKTAPLKKPSEAHIFTKMFPGFDKHLAEELDERILILMVKYATFIKNDKPEKEYGLVGRNILGLLEEGPLRELVREQLNSLHADKS